MGPAGPPNTNGIPKGILRLPCPGAKKLNLPSKTPTTANCPKIVKFHEKFTICFSERTCSPGGLQARARRRTSARPAPLAGDSSVRSWPAWPAPWFHVIHENFAKFCKFSANSARISPRRGGISRARAQIQRWRQDACEENRRAGASESGAATAKKS